MRQAGGSSAPHRLGPDSQGTRGAEPGRSGVLGQANRRAAAYADGRNWGTTV